jgi:molybdate transport system substrate-binding protein
MLSVDQCRLCVFDGRPADCQARVMLQAASEAEVARSFPILPHPPRREAKKKRDDSIRLKSIPRYNVRMNFESLRIEWRRKSCAVSILCVALILAGCRGNTPPTLTLSVAASLQEAIADVEASYVREHGSAVEFRNNFGSSGTLAREIENGAPVDAIISAGEKPVDDLAAKGLLAAGTRRNLLTNALVLIAPQDSKLTGFDALTAPAVKLVALGDPATVPAGQYGLETLQNLRLYDRIRSKIVLGKDVRQVLTYVETGNADAGLVYATDAKISTKVRAIAVAPESSHAPIVYPVAAIAGTRNEQAVRDFLAYLGSPSARAIFVKHGFTMV